MSIKTNLARSPYFNDYNTSKEYYEHLFKPSVAVQVRELNSLQSWLQNQIERFGDNIFKSGTIVSGCNFVFYPSYNYVKLADNNLDSAAIDPSLYVGLFAKNVDGLKAYITNSMSGFETADPYLKTIFINYINSGVSGNTQFIAGDILTIYNGKDSIFSVTINNGGLNFSNADSLVISSIIEVNTSTGTFAEGDYITDPVYNSNAEILTITSIDGSSNKLFTIKPKTTDLINVSSNSLSWTFGEQNSIKNSGNTAIGTIDKVYGSGAAGRVITDGVGKIISIFMTSKGEDYYHLPYVTVKSKNNASGIAALSLAAVNYYDKVRVSSVANPVGNGYAFEVSDGIIYQVGHFLKVDKQLVVVNAYSSTPNNASVGFVTEESIVDYLEDTTLTDNALGTENENAPGADRLKLVPTLTVANTDDMTGNTEFLALVQWNDGNPYKQTQTSVYSKLGDEMANRMNDQSGNFVLDPFLVTTDSVANSALNGGYYTTVVDPGSAYIAGYKTQTLRNFKIDVPKATETLTSTGVNISLNYDAYIRTNEVGGLFQFSTGDTVDLYNAAKTYLSSTSNFWASPTITAAGAKIGTARIRSMILENGYAGDYTAIYRLHLFNIQMNAGANFKNVKSVFYNGTNKGIADVVLELDPTTAANIAMLKNAQNDTLIFKTGVESIRNTNNTTYDYRTIDQTTNFANTGLLTKSIAGNPNETYPYSSTLSDSDLSSLYVVPIGNNVIGYTPLTGTVSVNTTSPNCIGSGTTFINNLEAGDYIRINSGGSNAIKKVKSITNNTLLVMESNNGFANAGTATFNRAFPQNVPIPFGKRSGLSANLNGPGTLITLNLGMTTEGTVSVNTALGVNIRRSAVTSIGKTSNRNQYVKLQLSNNAANTVGPWCLGIPDVFRLRNVYVGNSSVNTSSIDIGSEFFIDHNQKSNYLDLSYLHLNPKTSIALVSANFLLVNFDYFTRSDDGYFDTVSYLGTSNAAAIANLDSLPLANLTSTAASFEVPEMFTQRGEYYDLLNCVDFRPAVVNTVAVSACSATAPLNPPYALSFGNTADPANDKKFPIPDSVFTSTIEQYMGRTDVVVIGPDGNIVVQKGYPNVDATKRYPATVSSENLLLNKITVPAYPNITVNLSNTVVDVIDTSVHTNGKMGTRLASHTIIPIVANSQTSVPSQPKGYSMANIGKLERRIRDIEYYTLLNALETSITNKIIPSSIDGSINRFKFGFVADDFSTSLNSDVTNPQYSAEIEVVDNTVDTSNTIPMLASNLCVPPKFRWSLKHNASISLPYIDYKLVGQEAATTSIDPVQPACVPITVSTETLVQSNSLLFASSGTNGSNDFRDELMSISTRASTLSAPCTMFFLFVYDPFITVYQSTRADFTAPRTVVTSASAVALTNADKTYLKSDPETSAFWIPASSFGAGQFYQGLPMGGLDTLAQLGGGWVLGAGKIDFTHDPAFGRYYYVSIINPAGHANARGPAAWGYYGMLRYPTDEIRGQTIIDPCGSRGNPTGYNGVMVADYGKNSIIVPDGTREFDSIIMQCHGLLPMTKHDLYVNGIKQIAARKPYGGNLGADIYSDAAGRITAEYYLPMTNWANIEQELGLTKSGPNSTLILNEGQEFASSFIGNAYQTLEILAPNSRCGTNLSYVPWTNF